MPRLRPSSPPQTCVDEVGGQAVSQEIVICHALGVIAERFGVDIDSADGILREVARREQTDLEELAACVVASCTNDCSVLPRSLYAFEAA